MHSSQWVRSRGIGHTGKKFVHRFRMQREVAGLEGIPYPRIAKVRVGVFEKFDNLRLIDCQSFVAVVVT